MHTVNNHAVEIMKKRDPNLVPLKTNEIVS